MLFLFVWIALFFGANAFLKGITAAQKRSVFPHIEKLVKNQHYTLFSASLHLLAIVACISSISLCSSILLGRTPFDTFLAGASQKKKSLSASLFLLDCSGSMAEPFGNRGKRSKLDVMKKSIIKAVESHDKKNGMKPLLGADIFARASIAQVPLTYDRDYFYQKIADLSCVDQDRLNGTATGYALMKSILSIISTKILAEKKKEGAEIVSEIRCIIISDGIEEPHPDDAKDEFRSMRLLPALQLAQQQNIIVESILIGKGWQNLSRGEKERMDQEIAKTGGKVEYIEYEESLTGAIERAIGKNSSFVLPQSQVFPLSFSLSLYSMLSIMAIRGGRLLYRMKKEDRP